jgi:hypothetical protein
MLLKVIVPLELATSDRKSEISGQALRNSRRSGARVPCCDSCMFNFGKPKTAGDWLVHLIGALIALFLVWWLIHMFA